MSEATRAALTRVLPHEAVEAEETVGRYSVGGVAPAAVARPTDVREIQEVLRTAAEDGFGVTPVGTMIDLGCQAPERPFVVMATDRLAGIEDYEPADLTVTARAGTVLGDLSSVLGDHGQWLPCDPPEAPGRTLGGLVATGAGGGLAASFGATRNHVLGVTVVTGDARVLRLGGRVMKNVAGFDLVRLLTGSQGTLGVVVSATLRLFPRPDEDRLLVVDGDSSMELAGAVRTAPLVPASAWWMDPGPAGSGEAALVVRLLGPTAAVEAEERALLGAEAGSVRRLSGDAGAPVLASVRDASWHGEIVIRLWALPSALGDLVAEVRDALPVSSLAADVLQGKVRASLTGENVDARTLKQLRARVEGLGGDLVLERAPEALVKAVGAYGRAGDGAEIREALRDRFDPWRVMSVGRFS